MNKFFIIYQIYYVIQGVYPNMSLNENHRKSSENEKYNSNLARTPKFLQWTAEYHKYQLLKFELIILIENMILMYVTFTLVLIW